MGDKTEKNNPEWTPEIAAEMAEKMWRPRPDGPKGLCLGGEFPNGDKWQIGVDCEAHENGDTTQRIVAWCAGSVWLVPPSNVHLLREIFNVGGLISEDLKWCEKIVVNERGPDMKPRVSYLAYRERETNADAFTPTELTGTAKLITDYSDAPKVEVHAEQHQRLIASYANILMPPAPPTITYAPGSARIPGLEDILAGEIPAGMVLKVELMNTMAEISVKDVWPHYRESAETMARLTQRVSFDGLMKKADMAVRVIIVDKAPWLWMKMTTLNVRDGSDLDLSTKKGIPTSFEDPEEWLRVELRDFWLHEFMEGLLIDGEPLKEPHAGVPKYRGLN